MFHVEHYSQTMALMGYSFHETFGEVSRASDRIRPGIGAFYLGRASLFHVEHRSLAAEPPPPGALAATIHQIWHLTIPASS
jgi:hypothetical protein